MLHPIILAGGSGTRLWPVSRKSFPKQFTPFDGKESLFQTAVKNCQATGFAPPIVVTGSDYRYIASEQLAAVSATDAKMIVEPMARNTGPAILSAAMTLQQSPDAVLVIMPSDHMIADPKAFHHAIGMAECVAQKGDIAVLGVKPTFPATGFGYLNVGKVKSQRAPAYQIKQIVEKPQAEMAQDLFDSGTCYWSTGIFVGRVDTFLQAFERHARGLIAPCQKALDNGHEQDGVLLLDEKSFSRAAKLSIDYAVLEKLERCSVVPLNCDWSDLGSWKSVKSIADEDEHDNAVSGSATAIDCENSMLRSENPKITVVGLGLKDIVAVATEDGVLVADINHSEDIGRTVDALRAKKMTQAENFNRAHRPWGFYESLSLGTRFQVKRIVVKPGGKLSLQSHMHRAEHWVVVEGSARVTVGDEVKLLSENQSTYVPLGAVHRLENPGKLPLVLIEVQSGSYLGEDDIKRYEDIYDRESVVA